MIGAGMFVGGVNVDLAGVGAATDAMLEVAADDEATLCEAA
jgi:hypothetical protein